MLRNTCWGFIWPPLQTRTKAHSIDYLWAPEYCKCYWFLVKQGWLQQTSSRWDSLYGKSCFTQYCLELPSSTSFGQLNSSKMPPHGHLRGFTYSICLHSLIEDEYCCKKHPADAINPHEIASLLNFGFKMSLRRLLAPNTAPQCSKGTFCIILTSLQVNTTCMQLKMNIKQSY